MDKDYTKNIHPQNNNMVVAIIKWKNIFASNIIILRKLNLN